MSLSGEGSPPVAKFVWFFDLAAVAARSCDTLPDLRSL